MFRHATAAIAALGLTANLVAGQRPADSTRITDSSRAAALEGVIVRAVRANGVAPIAQTTVDTRTIQRRSFAQEVPLMLQGTVPSITAHAESGTNWGYSYLRLRGIDQSRINLSLDGIPLNDPEDQVFYFANLADLSSSIRSVQVQRGVGTTGTGTASFAGSINFETKSVFGAPRFAAGELQAGSYGAQRAMVEGNTGTSSGGFAASVRLSALRTNSPRRHAGVEGLSGLAQIGWVGSRDILKLMLLGGRLRDTLSYLAVPLNDLARDRSINPLSPDELDGFSQNLIALSHTRQLADGVQYATTLYRIAADGNYDVRFDSTTVGNYGLDFTWYGVTSALNVTRGALRLNTGVNANTYQREHAGYIKPDLTTPTYRNVGHKRDASAFTKVTLVQGPISWFADLQLRHATFRYQPDAKAGFGGAEPWKSWTFINPKLGATWLVRPSTELFASVGRTTREPTRSDLLAGNDDVSRATLDDLGGLSRLDPERVTSTEAGVRWRGERAQVELNTFRMDFRNEIARIGALSALGAELRSNVGASVRQGVEFDLRIRPAASVALTTVGAFSNNRIRQFTDSSGSAPLVRRNVAPLLTPAVTATQRIDWRAARWLDLGAEVRHQGRSFLRNDGNAAFTLPAFTIIDGMVRLPIGPHDLTIRGVNLGNSQRYGSGYVVDDVSNYFILPPRSVFVTLRIATR